MKLKILGSSSKGNCYILESSNEALIIEAGIRMSKIKKALKFDLNKVVGAIISHEHNDHAGYITEIVASGITALALESVFTSRGLAGKSFTKPIIPLKRYKVGGFLIMPLEVKHDVPCVGFIVDHKEMGRLLFVTDTMMLEFVVPGLNHIMIEANYADDILLDNIENGRTPESMRPRLLRSHMELETTKSILLGNDLSKVSNIILIHLSDGNSDEAHFVRETEELTGKCIYAANAGMDIDLSNEPY